MFEDLPEVKYIPATHEIYDKVSLTLYAPGAKFDSTKVLDEVLASASHVLRKYGIQPYRETRKVDVRSGYACVDPEGCK